MDENAQKRGSRKLRRFLVVDVALLVIVLVFYGLWRMGSINHLRARIVAIQARGEPILPEDFDVPDADAPDNAGTDILAAIKLINGEDDVLTSVQKLSPALPLRPPERDAIAKLSAQSGEIFKRLEAAMSKPRAVMNPQLRTPTINFLTPQLNELRSLATIIGDDALLAHERGEDATAMHRIDQLLLLSRYTDTHPTLMGHLLAGGISGIAADRAFQMAPDLNIGTSSQQVSPEHLRRTFDQLLDDRPRADAWRRAMLGERMLQFDLFNVIANGTPVQMVPNQPPQPYFNSKGRFVMQPLINNNASTALDYMTKMIPVTSETNLPAARSKMPAAPDRNSIANALLSILLPAFDRAFETHFRSETDRHLAATVLAIRWYAVEHDGEYPQDLGALVPKYLPAIPSDPMAPAGKSLRYVVGATPAVYSVGVNAIDDNGNGTDTRGDRYSWASLDHVIPLMLPARPQEDDDDVESPSTQPTTNP